LRKISWLWRWPGESNRTSDVGLKRAVCRARADVSVLFAGLAAAVEENLPLLGQEDVSLPGIGLEAGGLED